jgi:phosphate-selective porin OprO/OprP
MSDHRRCWMLLALLVPLGGSARAAEIDYGDRGLEFESESPPLELRLGGRLHLDFGHVDDDLTPSNDEFEVRRGRLYLSGRAFRDWRFKVEHDFAASGNGWKNVWIQYAFDEKTSVRVGNFVAPFGLEDVASSNYATFMERALPSAIAPSFQTGIGLRTRGRVKHRFGYARWTAAAGGFLEPLGDSKSDRHQSEHYGVSTRFTLAPLSEARRLVHLGVSFEYRDLRSGSGYRIRSRPESSLAPALFSTGTLGRVDDVFSLGVEAATVLGPFSAQAEYMRAMLDRGNAANPDFDGWYVQASWVVTGETRLYGTGSGAFRGVRPERRFGAVELALRYSSLDLVAAGISGGEGEDLTVGVNWYLRRNVRFSFNYVRVDSEQRGTGLDDDPDVFQARFLVFF